MEKEEQQQAFITDIAQLERERERKRIEEEKKAEIRAKKRKLIPPFVMLFAGAVTSITMYVLHYKAKDMLVILLCVLLAFYVAGELLKWMLDRFEAQIDEKRREAEAVYEKGPDGAIEHTVTESAKQADGDESVQLGRRDDDEEELIF